ncbi:helicase-like protein [Kribbella sp. VKM Ac-2527]|uniref:Helicase-like protein n=1 Tax=Kribbella caucasensis TaxID=2512215 RepID=A0A4V3C5I7_9ACTN|nr:DISARM system helicase DrmA [Kribbella sp. VKM Ac-2527]TDO30038.1 helicase-like protein [Kribbella sp. VKM Ac-2527]
MTEAQSTAPSLELAQEFDSGTSYEIRDEIEELLRRDLLGPWGGDDERLPTGTGPRERYLVGMLGPRHEARSVVADASDVPDTQIGVEADASDPELPEILTPQSLGRIWASSMGMAFAVSGDVDVLKVRYEWARYERRQATDEKGKITRAWEREPYANEREVRIDGGTRQDRLPLTATTEDEPGVQLAVTVRPRDGRRVVELALINAQAEPLSGDKEPVWLFQTNLILTAADDAKAIFLPVEATSNAQNDSTLDDPEDVHLQLLYRHQHRYASGRNVAVDALVREGETAAYKLQTTWLPAYEVPATVAPTGSGSPLAEVELSMDTLATAPPEALGDGLRPLVSEYRAWIDLREGEIDGLPTRLQPSARVAVAAARSAAQRIEAGITLLADPTADRHADALEAFRFANKSMALQRRHTSIARIRQDEGLDYRAAAAKVEAEGAKAASWRPFQLAFVLLNLPSLTDPAHPERAAASDAVVDLLFFPTGGGKTEAYLGLTAYTLGIRRLQGIVGTGGDARDGRAGTAVLMRYTLRLLTAQQFQRASALICAAEVLRQEDEKRWGAEPFRIGMWVGSGVSPNWYDDAATQIAEARASGDGRHTNVLQVLACPWCGTPLRTERDLHVDDETRRVLLHCPNGEGVDACPFSRRRTSEGLPILTVDEEIYRYAPSLVIATVDKLAQLPWRGFAGHLFGHVTQTCPRHGFRHPDLDPRVKCGSRHNKSKGGLDAVVSHAVRTLRPPDLIIQDELHLISGALGTTVGLFEAAVDQLCTWTVEGAASGVGPKIVASTATTKRARAQVLGLFARQLAVFPPQVSDVRDTFFSIQVELTPKQPGRRYLGICAHGVRMKAAEIRLAEILLLAGQTVFDKYGSPADPYLTLVGYFNAVRELAGMRRYLDDDVTTRVRRDGRRLRGISDRIITRSGMLSIQELTSRISSGDISDVLARLEIGFDDELDSSARRRAIADDLREALSGSSRDRRSPHALADRWSERRRNGREPADVVLATSMLQVGVDVSRFGLMLVTGQPKNTAEYIQATSRVGRDAERPGLVVTLYNWARPRDLAHFEDFAHYHATFYQQVEALSVTPYTRRALDRGAAATFVTAVRHAGTTYSRDADAHDVPLDSPLVREIIERLARRAEHVDGMRGRNHLEEKLRTVVDRWQDKKSRPARLAYEASRRDKEQLQPLLERAGGNKWDVLTVGLSMRETEPDINLLVPGGDQLFAPLFNAPAWSFGRPDAEDASEAGDDEVNE